MDHYQEFQLRTDPEFTPSVLMNALFGKLHRALVSQNSQTIGVSFPDIAQERTYLGDRLRLHGTREDLEHLMKLPWLTGLRDHLFIGTLSKVSDDSFYCVVRRVQAKSNAERLRRRRMYRKGVTMDQARLEIPDSAEERLTLPFITLKSQSSGQTFRLFIDQSPPQSNFIHGAFNQYGLSPTATIPWF